MPRLVHVESGTTVYLEGEDYQRAIASGKYTPVDSQVEATIAGAPALLPQEAAELRPGYAAHAQVGSVSPEQRSGAEATDLKERIWGTPGQKAATFGEGILDAASLGGYSALNEAVGGEFAEREEVNPGYNTAGEFVGIAASVLAPGGGLIAAGKGGKVGAALAKTPGGLLATKTTKLAEAIGGLKGAAAGQALEGATYATAQTLSDAYVHDKELTAGALWATVGRDALFGSGVGVSGAVLAKGLAKVAGKAEGIGMETAPVLDMTSKQGRKVATKVVGPLRELDSITDEVAAGFSPLSPKPVKGAYVEAPGMPGQVPQPVVSGSTLKANRAGAQMLDTHGLPGVQQAEGLAQHFEAGAAEAARVQKATVDAALSPADAPLQRRKILKSVGEQLVDEGTLLGKLSPKEIARARRVFGEVDEAVTFARESGTKAAAAGANRALAKYENELAELAKKIGSNVDDQLDASRRYMEVVKGSKGSPVREFSINPEKTANRMTGDLAGFEEKAADLSFKGRVTSADPSKMAPDLLDLNPHIPRPTRDPFGIPVKEGNPFATRAADLDATRGLALEAFGLKKGQFITEDALRSLMSKAPDEVLVGLNRLDDHVDVLRRAAEELGDADLVVKIDKAINDLNESIGDITGGIKLSDVDRSVIASSLGSEALGKAEFKTKVGEKLHELAALTKITRGAKLPPGVTRKAAYNGLLMSASARAAARGASRLGNQVGGGGLLGAIFGGAGAATAFKVIHSMGALTGAATGRVARAVGKASKLGSKVARPAALTAAWLVRESNWNTDPDAAKNTPKAGSLQEAFKLRAAELAKIQANPDAAQAAIHNELAPLRKFAPQVADELEMLSISVPLYLADKMPKDPGNVMRWGKSHWRPSEYEIMQWGEHVRGATAPIEVFEDMMQSGYITPQAADAIRTLHKPLFNQMQQEVFMRADELRDKLDYQGQVRVSVFFQVPVTSTMRPEFRAFNKERHALRAQTQAPTGQRNLGTSSGGADAAEPMTGAQQLLKQ